MLQWPNNITLLMFAHQWRVTAPEIEMDKSCTISHLKYPNGSLFHDQTNFGMISQGPVSFVEFPNRWREIEMKSLRFNNKVAKRVLLKLVWQGRKRKREIEKIFGKKVVVSVGDYGNSMVSRIPWLHRQNCVDTSLPH